jgi:GAF domain-containing protein
MGKDAESYYKSLYEVAMVLNSAHAPEVVLQSIVERLAKVMGAKGCALMLLAPGGKTLLHTVAYGLSGAYLKKGPVTVDKSISESLEGKPVIIPDATKDERVQYQEQARKEGIASILSMPIKLRQEIIGVIRVYTGEPRQFTADEVFFVEAVANLGAIALENANLYVTIEKDYETIRRQMLEYYALRRYLA